MSKFHFSPKWFLTHLIPVVFLFTLNTSTGNGLQQPALKDSLKTKSKYIEQQKVHHDTSHKEKTMPSLQNIEKRQRVELEQAKQSKTFILIGFFLVCLFLAFVSYAYNVKKKGNKQLLLQQVDIKIKNTMLQQLVDEKENLLKEQERLLDEKEWLLKEVHHRLNNNLHIINGLLFSQSAYLKDKNAIKAIKQSQQRIYSIALIHQKVYLSEKTHLVKMQDYIEDLILYIKDCLNIDANKIAILLAIASQSLKVSQAIPIGLIINEAVTNSIKYAFIGKEHGEIHIKFSCDDNACELLITDNGCGFAKEYNPDKETTLGLALIKGFSEQLEGNIMIKNNNGLTIKVSFLKEIESILSNQHQSNA